MLVIFQRQFLSNLIKLKVNLQPFGNWIKLLRNFKARRSYLKALNLKLYPEVFTHFKKISIKLFFPPTHHQTIPVCLMDLSQVFSRKAYCDIKRDKQFSFFCLYIRFHYYSVKCKQDEAKWKVATER